VLAALSEVWVGRARREDGLRYVLASGLIAGVALAKVLSFADDPERRALVFGACALGGWLGKIRWAWPWLTVTSSALLLANLLFLFAWLEPDMPGDRAWLLSFLTGATMLLAMLVITSRTRRLASLPWMESALAGPLSYAVDVATVIAVLPLLASIGWDWLIELSLCTLWLGALWLGLWRVLEGGWFSSGGV